MNGLPAHPSDPAYGDVTNAVCDSRMPSSISFTLSARRRPTADAARCASKSSICSSPASCSHQSAAMTRAVSQPASAASR